MTITVQLNECMEYVAQRVLCWAGADKQLVQTNSAAGSRLALTIPDEVMERHGPLYLKTGGPDVAAMNVHGLYQSVNVGNGDVLSINPDSCADDGLMMTMTTTNGLTWTCTAPSGTSINWGDGDVDQSTGAPYTHTYAPGKYQMTLKSGTKVEKTWLLIPSNVGLSSGGTPAPCPDDIAPVPDRVEPNRIYANDQLWVYGEYLDEAYGAQLEAPGGYAYDLLRGQQDASQIQLLLPQDTVDTGAGYRVRLLWKGGWVYVPGQVAVIADPIFDSVNPGCSPAFDQFNLTVSGANLNYVTRVWLRSQDQAAADVTANRFTVDPDGSQLIAEFDDGVEFTPDVAGQFELMDVVVDTPEGNFSTLNIKIVDRNATCP